MILFVIAIILVLIGLAALAGSFVASNAEDKTGLRVTASILAVLTIICLFFSCATTVDTKNVGVLTTFGRPSGYLDNGFHLTLPWQNVTELNDAVQTDTYATDEGSNKKQGGATDTCVHVRIERQATACVNVSIKWQIRPDGVDYLFRNYKDNGAITDNLVLRNLQQGLNTAFTSYDPLGLDANGKNTNPSLTTYANQVKAQLAGKDGHSGDMGKYIDVQSVIVPLINYDSNTQSKVNQLLQQIAATRVAIQAEQTSVAQAKANHALAASVSHDPNVLTDKCLNILKEAVDNDRQLPAGFSCFGAGTGIAVGTK